MNILYENVKNIANMNCFLLLIVVLSFANVFFLTAALQEGYSKNNNRCRSGKMRDDIVVMH
jgi:hypothetical protein